MRDNLVQESAIQAKIEKLIRKLEDEVRRLSSFHQAELSRSRNVTTGNAQYQHEQFEARLSLINAQYQSKILNLESEIDYLKELNYAQRLMMEDILGYIKDLEEKLNATSATAPEPGAAGA
ncbi:hypothetical protein [Chryseolinea lacunae]|uniref:Uncharacterized protein n=1 Tax=Chryseolinea lacunae TaxID=2801331 RepID=A0ABS1L1Z8_9BACT|nr:hypothetical protein [Chryseolinea lacunae]MBL0745562.1 hypothetical protein [Chryseolinea lacunae]